MPGDNLSDLLRIFRSVADTGSFSAAGRNLNMSPAWVAKQVTRLEGSLGAALLIRSTRALRLTDAGRESYQTAGTVADELAVLKDKLSADSKMIVGTVRLNVPSIIAQEILARHLTEFQTKYPNLRLDIDVSESFAEILNEEIDIAFRVTRALDDSQAIAERISSVPRILCASKDYLSRMPEIENIQDIKHHKALAFTGLQGPSSWFLRSHGSEERITPNVVVHANNSFVLKQAAIDGAGIAFLPKVIVEDALRSGQLVHLPQIEDADPFNLFLMRAPRTHLPIRIQVAWRYFAKVCKSNT